MAFASDLTESFYNACRGTFLFLRRFLRLISTPKNLYKGTKFGVNLQTLFHALFRCMNFSISLFLNHICLPRCE